MICMFKAIHYCQQVYLRTFERCLEIYEINPACFLTAPGLAWQDALKKTKVKLELLTDIDILLMQRKFLEEEYVTLFINTQKVMIKTKNLHIFNIGIS